MLPITKPTELRCFCSSRPLLAVVDIDKKGAPFVHLKVHKQSRVYGEVVVTSGEINVRCRSCLRWHRVNIRTADVDFRPDSLPEVIEI